MRFIKSLLAFFVAVVLLSSPVMAENNDSYEMYGDRYSVKMVVNPNGSIDVDVNFDVTFNIDSQGIFLDVPQTYEMVFKVDGQDQKRSYFFPVSDITSDTHEIDVEENRQGVRIRLGSRGVYLLGAQTFNVQYTIQTTDLRLDGLQMFYMNMMPNRLDFPVGKLDYEIEFVKPVEGSYFVYNPNVPVIENTLQNNVIKGSYENELSQKTVTVEVPLPNDYFTFPRIDYVKPALILGLLVASIIMIGYFLLGKDPIVIESVEFTAPEGISSAEVGYIYRGMTTSKDIVSLIVYWASKGFLKIIEEEDVVSLEKIVDLPNDWNIEERRLFNKVFEQGDLVTLDSLNNKIGETVMHLQASIPGRFSKDKNMRVYDRRSSMMKLLSVFILPLIVGFMGFAVIYLKTSYRGDALVGFFVAYGIFFIASVIGASILAFDRVYKRNRRILNAILIIGPVFAIGYGLSVIFGSQDYEYYVLGSLLLFSISLFFAANTSRRTPKGAMWVGQIRGLKRFIEVAEKDRLIQLVEETPFLFYDILPYAYVLGVTDVWTKKFESIAIQQPDWFVTSNPNLTTFMMINHLNRSMTSMNTSLTSVPISSGSGGGSFGGGGGGGFSGGGFGGGGGGRW